MRSSRPVCSHSLVLTKANARSQLRRLKGGRRPKRVQEQALASPRARGQRSASVALAKSSAWPPESAPLAGTAFVAQPERPARRRAAAPNRWPRRAPPRHRNARAEHGVRIRRAQVLQLAAHEGEHTGAGRAVPLGEAGTAARARQLMMPKVPSRSRDCRTHGVGTAIAAVTTSRTPVSRTGRFRRRSAACRLSRDGVGVDAAATANVCIVDAEKARHASDDPAQN